MAENNPYIDAHNDTVLDRKAKTTKPKMYQVVFHNDDYTPMDFVVTVLMRFFNLAEDPAVAVMLSVHKKGQGIAGVFTKEIAETKVDQTMEYARENEHPLSVSYEPVPG